MTANFTPGGFGYHLRYQHLSGDTWDTGTDGDPEIFVQPPDDAVVDDPVVEIDNPGTCGNFDTYKSTGAFLYKSGPASKKAIQQDTAGTTAITIGSPCVQTSRMIVRAIVHSDNFDTATGNPNIFGTTANGLVINTNPTTPSVVMGSSVMPNPSMTFSDWTTNYGTSDWQYIEAFSTFADHNHTAGSWSQGGWVSSGDGQFWGGSGATGGTNSLSTPYIGWDSLTSDVEYPVHAVQCWLDQVIDPDDDADIWSRRGWASDWPTFIQLARAKHDFWWARYSAHCPQLASEPWDPPLWKASNIFDGTSYGSNLEWHFDSLYAMANGAGMDPILVSFPLVASPSANVTNGWLLNAGRLYDGGATRFATALNGFPVMACGPNQTWEQYNLPMGEYMELSGPFTEVIVFYVPSTHSTTWWWGTRADGTGWHGLNAGKVFADTGATNLTLSTNTVAQNAWHIVVIRRDGSDDWKAFVDGTDDTVGTPNNSGVFNMRRMYRSNTVPSPIGIPTNTPRVAAHLIYNESFTLSQINNLCGALSTRYNLGQTWSLS